MKKIEEDKLIALLGIIPSSPALRIVHFSNSGEQLVKTISDFSIKNDYEYQINCTSKMYYETIHNYYKTNQHIKPIYFTLERPSYMIQGKVYDFLFVTIPLEAVQRKSFLKKTHTIIKNAGNILIFLPKGDYEERYHWLELLEETNYVASNTIDDLFENYDVLISKKMHGWGN